MDGFYTSTRHWWALALRGLFALLFGIAALFWPAITLIVLVWLFGAYALVDGVFGVVAGLSLAGQHRQWWLLLVEGIVGIVAGLGAFLWTGITALALLYLIAAWAIVTGVFEIVAAFERSEWWLGLSGLLSVLFGLLLVLFPGAGALSVVWIIGFYSLVFGVLMLVHAFQARNQPARA
jgi:uncharacterized membrane protein HdeD (DUF308 family)